MNADEEIRDTYRRAIERKARWTRVDDTTVCRVLELIDEKMKELDRTRGSGSMPVQESTHLTLEYLQALKDNIYWLAWGNQIKMPE